MVVGVRVLRVVLFVLAVPAGYVCGYWRRGRASPRSSGWAFTLWWSTDRAVGLAPHRTGLGDDLPNRLEDPVRTFRGEQPAAPARQTDGSKPACPTGKPQATFHCISVRTARVASRSRQTG